MKVTPEQRKQLDDALQGIKDIGKRSEENRKKDKEILAKLKQINLELKIEEAK